MFDGSVEMKTQQKKLGFFSRLSLILLIVIKVALHSKVRVKSSSRFEGVVDGSPHHLSPHGLSLVSVRIIDHLQQNVLKHLGGFSLAK